MLQFLVFHSLYSIQENSGKGCQVGINIAKNGYADESLRHTWEFVALFGVPMKGKSRLSQGASAADCAVASIAAIRKSECSNAEVYGCCNSHMAVWGIFSCLLSGF
jgi:hypothetical protein